MLHTFSGNSKNNKTLLTSLLLITLIATPFLLLLNSQPANAAENVLTAKWSRSDLGTNWEGGLVIGDVTGDGSEDIVYAGGGSDIVYVLNGATGDTIATYVNTRIGTYCQPQLYDVNGDGVLDILVPLYSRPGLAVVTYDGDSTLNALWVRDTQGTSGSGSCMSKPVAGDIDGDGHVEIYIACQDVSPAYSQSSSTGQPIPDGYDGTVTMFDYQGNILAQNFNWRSCSGGLSLADTDNDGEFELYMGDRSMYYSDGNYGKGTIAYWARNLSIIWQRLDFLSSSQAPVIVDVNGDGVLDVLSGMYREMNIQNSSNGAIMQSWSGGSLNVMSVHYGFTVYDIDGDGHQELLCCDGDHDDDPYADVVDLVTGQLEAELNLAGGDSKWSPIVADISPTQPGMEIICVPNGTTLETGYWRGAIMIFNRNFESIQNITRFNGSTLSSQLAYPVVQDIDGDGLLELVTHSSSGTIYAFDTQAPKPAQRIRSEVTYFGEKRTGVAQYEIPPWGTNYWVAPLVAPVSPANDALNVPVTTTQLSFNMREHQGQNVSYTVTTSPNIGSASGSSIGNSYNWRTYTVNINSGSLNYDTTYTWTVTATDGTYTTTKTYMFHTALAPTPAGNSPPTQSNPTLTPTDGTGSTSSTFVAANQSTTDANRNSVTNVYRWLINGVPAANLQLPFDLRSATSTKDYAYGNSGIVKGATWVPNGVVGGAYSFDGQNDAIIISDGGKGYYDNKTYSDNQPELGGDGTWTQLTVEAWINLKANNAGSRIVAKIPSYELGFQSGSTNTLMASVWPKSGVINYNDDNHASSDRVQTVTASVDLQLNTWYHIAFTYKSGEGIKLYLNGQLVAQRTGVSGALEESLGEPVYIGRLVEAFNGLIDEVAIYPYAQSAEQIALSYQQSVNGSSSNATFIPVGLASPSDTLTVQVTPTDSYSEGTTRSASFNLLNSPPVASDLMIYPLRDRIYRLDGETLTASYQYTDTDGNPESGSQIRWYLNGALQSQYNNVLQVPAANTVVGQNWYFTVTPRDSLGGAGATQTSASVTIRSNTAPTTNTPTLATVSGNLVATAQGTSDADGDATTNIFHWTKNGVSQTNLQLPFDTETPRTTSTNPSTNDYSGYGNDGTLYGATWTQDGVVGGGLSFDGTDYLRVQEHSNSLGGNGWSEISVEFWIKSAGVLSSSENVVLKHDTSYSVGINYGGYYFSPSYGVGYRADFRSYADRDRFYWYVYNSTGSESVEYSDYTNYGSWHHVVCTYKSGVGLQLYVDGELRDSVAFSGNIYTTLDGILDIGGVGGTSDFAGYLDEVRVYPTMLSASQVLQRYTETKDGLSSSNTISAQEAGSVQDWDCEVTPNDSWQDGTAKSSSSNPPTQYNLVINPSTNGFTVPAAGTYQYTSGSTVQVQAVPNTGYYLNYWLVNGVNVGAANPYTVNVNRDVTCTAVFALTQTEPTYLFSDDFENANFDQWDGTLSTSGETVTIGTTTYQGSYSARYTTNGGGSTERAYSYVSFTGQTELYVRGYFNIQDGLPLQVNNDRFNFYALQNPSGSTVASAGVRRNGGVDVWSVTSVAGTWYASSGPSMNQWYCVELCIKIGSPDGALILYVDGNPVITQTGLSLSSQNSIVQVRSGLSYAYNILTPIDVYSDSIVASTQYIGPQGTTPANVYQVDISVNGNGNTNPSPGLHTLTGTTQVQAIPASGYMLSYWLLNGSNVGSTNPITLNANANYTLTAVFTQQQPEPGQTVFSDGFETGTFNAWSSTTRTTGETATVASNIKHSGSYSACFTSNGDSSYERAYASRSGLNLAEVYTKAYVYVDPSGIVDNSDRFYFIQLMAGGNILAYGGWRQDANGNLLWHIMIRDGSNTVGAYSTVTPATRTWYLVELHWKADATNGLGELYVDGTLVASISSRNTANYGNATIARVGLPEIYNCASTTVYIDDAAVSTSQQSSPSEPQRFYLTVGNANGGTTNPSAGAYAYDGGSQAVVSATPNSGYQLNGWLLDGVSVAGINPYSLTMNGNHSLTAVFTQQTEPHGYVFSDDFETGNFNSWPTTAVTSGETANVNTNPVYAGNYAAVFTANGDNGYEKAYATRALTDELDQVYVQCACRLTQNGLADSGDRIKLVELRSGTTIIAAAGLAVRNGVVCWWLETRDGTSYVETYSSSSADVSGWFTLELQWSNSAVNGGGTIRVNGEQVLQVGNDNTGNYGDCTSIRVGLAELYNCGETTLAVDNAVVDTAYIP
jgi:hypothetical protein